MKDVIIVGGTHGNEWTGITIIENLRHQIKFSNKLALNYLLANPEAYKINKRFVDEDLNRVFAKLDCLESPSTYEFRRASEIRKELLAKPESVILDLHTTTSNMGRTLILTGDSSWHKRLGLYVSQHLPDTKIILAPDDSKKYLATQLDRGAIIEVGACPQGVNNPLVIDLTLGLINCILDFISNDDENISGSFECYVEKEEIQYPQISGMISAMIHPEMINREFSLLKKGDALFKHFNGETEVYGKNQSYYPIFINEAAYYSYNIALILCEKMTVTL